MAFRFGRTTVVAICLVLVCAFDASSASASKIDDKRRQAQDLQQAIAENGEKISMLAEKFDEAKLQLDDAKGKIARVQARVAAAQLRQRGCALSPHDALRRCICAPDYIRRSISSTSRALLPPAAVRTMRR